MVADVDAVHVFLLTAFVVFWIMSGLVAYGGYIADQYSVILGARTDDMKVRVHPPIGIHDQESRLLEEYKRERRAWVILFFCVLTGLLVLMAVAICTGFRSGVRF
jgi:hypothetical protein